MKQMDNGQFDDLTYRFMEEYRQAVLDAGIKFYVAEGLSSDPAHGGTHGPGGFDLHGSTRTWEQCVQTAIIGRKLGAAVWPRNMEHGGFKQHIHGVLIDHPDASTNSRRQWQAYEAGYNGLGLSSGFRNGKDYIDRSYVGRRWSGLSAGSNDLPDLNVGSKGEYVLAVQKFLKSHYSYASGISTDGIFGPQTAGVVKQWKTRSGYYNDSEINETIWNALKKAGLQF